MNNEDRLFSRPVAQATSNQPRISIFRFTNLCLHETLRTTWEKADTGATLFGIVAPVIVHFLPQWESALNGLAWQIPLACLASVGTTRLILSPFLVYRKRDEEAKRSETQLAELLQPVIKISTVPPPQENYYPAGDNGIGYRVEVINLSKGRTVKNVEVKLSHIEPASHAINGLPLPLHQMNDNTNPSKTSFSLNPDDSKFIDVVGSRGAVQGIMVHHIVPGVTSAITHGDYVFTLIATGEDIPAESVKLHVWDTDGTLHCELL